jgi:hypothetical protein
MKTLHLILLLSLAAFAAPGWAQSVVCTHSNAPTGDPSVTDTVTCKSSTPDGWTVLAENIARKRAAREAKQEAERQAILKQRLAQAEQQHVDALQARLDILFAKFTPATLEECLIGVETSFATFELNDVSKADPLIKSTRLQFVHWCFENKAYFDSKKP